MATIQRPGKEGNATTYQGKVAAGYLNILAQEVDADIDAIYSAWNAGVDTVNIKDGSITGAKLAAGAVGSRELQDGGIQTVDLGDGQVTTLKLADGAVTQVKVSGGIVPGGTASGDLTGTYPAPALGTIQSGQVTLGHGGRTAAIAGLMEISINEVGVPGSDATQPSWLLRLDATGDSFIVLRAPPGSGVYVNVAAIDSAGILHAILNPGAVARTQLAVNAPNGSVVTAYCPAGFSLGGPSAWTTVATLPALTTRGGFVHIHANHTLSGYGPPGGVVCSQRLLRDGSPILQQSFIIASPSPSNQTQPPWPHMTWVDAAAAAGSHVYSHQVQVGNGAAVFSTTNPTDGGYMAVEVG